MLKETYKNDNPLYAKIGCRHRDTYTSTKLQLIVYSDKQCSQIYSEDEMKSDGYDINGYFLSNKVSSTVERFFDRHDWGVRLGRIYDHHSTHSSIDKSFVS